MATPVWPATIPQNPVLGGWTWKAQDNKVSFKPEIGPSIERRRGTAIVHNYDAKFPPFTAAEVATFETWFQDDLKSGTLHFLMDDPTSGTSFKWKIATYQFSNMEANRFDLSMKINRLPGAAV